MTDALTQSRAQVQADLNKIERMPEFSELGAGLGISQNVLDTILKTINGMSIKGSGNVEIPTYTPFDPQWRNDTISHLLVDIDNDVRATEGKSYLGEVTHVTEAEGLFDGNAEIVVNVMRELNSTNKIIWCIVSSNNVDPYHWEATFSNGSISAKGWTPFVPATRTIAGIDLKDNITAQELEQALGINGKVTNPMTTAGDMIVGGASGTPTRFPMGTAGQIIATDGTRQVWIDHMSTADIDAMIADEILVSADEDPISDVTDDYLTSTES